MTNLQEKATIQKAIYEVLTAKGLSQNEYAKMVKVSSANISHILGGKWDRISHEIWEAAYIPARKNDLVLVSTDNYQAVMNECLTTQQEHLLTCLLGEAGHGKTTALTSFFQSNPHVYYVNLQYANTKRDMIETIAQALTLETDASISQLVKRIAAKLNSAKDSLLIIDEISITKEYTINYLRDIRDRTRHNAGMLLAGCPYFKSNLEKSVRLGKQGIPEFVSRVGLFLNLSVPSKEEKEAICRANGIDEPLVIKSLTGCKDYCELETAIMRIMNKKPKN